MNGDLLEIAVKIGLSALLAGLVGAEREWTGKAAGLRTHMLIAVGAALLTDVSIGVGDRFGSGSEAWDPGRIAAQIVSGVGFLGAGTIIQARGAVRGLTTAAGLWVAAALGLAVGARFYVEAAVTTVVLLAILVLLRPVEDRVLRRHREEMLVALGEDRELSDLVEMLHAAGVEIRSLALQESEPERVVLVVFAGGEREKVAAVLEAGGFEVGPGNGSGDRRSSSARSG